MPGLALDGVQGHGPGQTSSMTTRARVEATVRELGYRPSRVARRLRVAQGSSDLIGLVIPDLQNPFFADLARDVEDVATRHGYTVLIGDSDESVEKEARYLNAMMAEAVDGIILPPSCEGRSTAVSIAPGPACRWSAWITHSTRRGWIPWWWTTSAGRRRRPGTSSGWAIGGSVTSRGKQGVSTTRERLEGAAQRLTPRDRGRPCGVVVSGDWRPESGRRLAAKLLDLLEPPTALLVGNGMMTLGALEAIHIPRDCGFPDELAVVGYDDMPWALALAPALTVVRPPPAAGCSSHGAAAAEDPGA